MKKLMLAGVLLALLGSMTQANEVKVEFGFFDSPATQAKKFEDAFRQNDRISGINIDGRSLSLGSEWIVLNAWSSLEPYRTSDKMGSTGVLVLGKIDNKKLYDNLYLRIGLQAPQAREFRTALSTVCAPKKEPFFSEFSRAEDKFQSCMNMEKWSYEDKGSNAGRLEVTIKGYAAAHGLSIQPTGEKMLTANIYESRRATAIYASRDTVLTSTDPEELKRFAQDLRRSIQRNFYKD